MHLRLIEMAVRKNILLAESERSVLELFIAGIEAFVDSESRVDTKRYPAR
jgi:hypothetical protein